MTHGYCKNTPPALIVNSMIFFYGNGKIYYYTVQTNNTLSLYK